MVDDAGNLLIEYRNKVTPSFKTARVAFVKQDCYQDLWIGGEDDAYQDLLQSTQMRIGPIGLKTLCNCKFLIVKFESSRKGTDYFKHQSFLDENDVKLVKQYRSERISPHLSSNSSKFHADYSKDVDQVDWERFDVVICINSPIPYKLRRHYPDILWACMPGEGICDDHKLHRLKYDCYLNHNWALTRFPRRGIYVDFPYTFVGPDDLSCNESRADKLDKAGIYLEINSGSSKERPPRLSAISDALLLQEKTGLTIQVHKGNIDDHLNDLMHSKYFVKLGGRPTRGNAFMEAISANSLILMRPDDCFGNMTLPMRSYFETIDELCDSILHFESNPDSYYSLLEEQKKCLMKYGVYFPLQQLAYVFNSKSKVIFRLTKELEYLWLCCVSLKKRVFEKILSQSKFLP